MVLEWLKGATGVFSAGDRGAARSPAQARPPARRVRIQEDAKAAAAARVTREKEKARKDTPRKKNQSRAPSSRLKDDFVVDKKVLGEGHYGVVRRCSPRADPSAPARKSQPATRAPRPRYTTRATYPSKTSSRSRVRRRRPRSSSARATSTIPRRFLTRNSKSSCTRPAREACNFRSLLDSDPAGTYPGPLCRFGGRIVFPKRPFALSNRLKTTPFQKQPEIAPRRGRGPSPVRRCSSGSARASSAAPPEQSPARRDRGQRQRRVKRPASRPASENVPRLGRVQLACQCHGLIN